MSTEQSVLEDGRVLHRILTTRTDCIDMYSMRGAVECSSLCQVHHRTLRCAMTRKILHSNQAHDARDIDYPASVTVSVRSLSHHLCRSILAPEENAFGVYSVGYIPCRLRGCPDGLYVGSLYSRSCIVDHAWSTLARQYAQADVSLCEHTCPTVRIG